MEKYFSNSTNMKPAEFNKLLRKIKKKSKNDRITGSEIRPILQKFFGGSNQSGPIRGLIWLQSHGHLIIEGPANPVNNRVLKLGTKILELPPEKKKSKKKKSSEKGRFTSPSKMNEEQLLQLFTKIHKKSKDKSISGSKLKSVMDNFFGESKKGIHGLKWMVNNNYLLYHPSHKLTSTKQTFTLSKKMLQKINV